MTKAGEKPPEGFYDYSLSGEFSTGYVDAFGVKRAKYAEYAMGQRWHVGACFQSERYVLELMTAIYTGTDLANTSLSAAAYERVPEFVEEGLVERTGDNLRLSIPALTTAEHTAYLEIANACIERTVPLLVEPLYPLAMAGEVKLPTHLTSVPRERQFMYAAYQLPMLLLRRAVESGNLAENPRPHAMLFIVDR